MPGSFTLLTSNSQKQILISKGHSGYSKSALLSAAAKYAKALCVPTAHVDFKDTKLLSEANVLCEPQLGLGSILREFAVQENPDRWMLCRALRALQEPALVLLDTYEKASETNELVE